MKIYMVCPITQGDHKWLVKSSDISQLEIDSKEVHKQNRQLHTVSSMWHNDSSNSGGALKNIYLPNLLTYIYS